MKLRTITRFCTLVLSLSLLAACSSPETGTLAFNANGEDFVRQGFVSKDGWQINFDTVLIQLSNIEAYQSAPAYDAHSDSDSLNALATIALDGEFAIDLAAGDENADPILVGSVGNAPAGHFNAIAFDMIQNSTGYSLEIRGQAEKEGTSIPFTLLFDQEFKVLCGEYVGDVRKGIVSADGDADLEMTFHFDHIFGDAGTPLDDSLNLLAPGFDPFAAIANDGVLELTWADMQALLEPGALQLLEETLPTLPHVGEGHCHITSIYAE